jgi:hypothetical protein
MPLILAAAIAAIPAVASASRAPTSTERAAVARAIPAPARCAQVRISSVEGKYRYARVTLNSRRADCRNHVADGVAVFKRRVSSAARWHFVTAGSAFSCPVPHVPKRVVADLKIDCYDG